MEDRKQQFRALMEAEAAKTGGRLGTGTFIRGALDFIKSLALAQIDTEAERDTIKDFLLTIADTLVAAKFPGSLWTLVVRPALDSIIDEQIDKLPALIGG